VRAKPARAEIRAPEKDQALRQLGTTEDADQTLLVGKQARQMMEASKSIQSAGPAGQRRQFGLLIAGGLAVRFQDPWMAFHERPI
jgi:hypothetical protein